MADHLNVIFKVLLLSALLSLAIKYGAPYLPLVPTTGLVILMIVLPSLIMGGILTWQWRKLHQGELS